MADRSVVIRLRGDITDFQSKMRQASVTAKGELSKQLKNVRENQAAFDDLGQKAGKVGLAAAAGLTAVTVAAMDWESAWAGVSKTVDGTESQMSDLEDSLRGLAKVMPATHDEIAAVAEAAGQLGVARADIADFTETMVMLAETTNLTADEAATSIAQMANVMGTAPDEIDNLGAALVALGNDGASTERDIIQMAQGISGAAAVVGLAESDVLGIANAVSSMGIEVEAGGSSISTVLTKIGKATAQGGAKLDAFAEAAGMSAEQFATSFKDDPAQAFASFIEGLGGIQAAGGDVFTVLEQLGLSDIRVSRALLGMASNSELLTDSLELGAKSWEDNKALSDEYAKRLDTTAAQVQIAWNNIKDAAIEAGAVMLPIVENAAGVVGGLADAFGSLPGPVQSGLSGLLGITAVLGGGLWFGSKVVNSVHETKDAIDALGLSAGRAKGGLRALTLAGGALAAVGIADALNDMITESQSLDVGPLARDLAILGDSGAITGELLKGFGEDFGGVARDFKADGKSLADTIAAVADDGNMRKIDDFLGGALPGGATDVMKDRVTDLDAALVDLSQQSAPLAAKAFDEIAAAAAEQGVSVDDVRKAFPDYTAEVKRAGKEAGVTADATDEMADSSKRSATAAQMEADALEASVEAMKAKREEALAALDAELGYAQAVLNVSEREERRKELLAELAAAEDPEERARIREELEDYALTLNTSTQAGVDNMKMLAGLADAWNNQDDATKNAKGSYKAARLELIETAMKFGATRKEARRYARELLEIPSRVKTKVIFDVDVRMSNKAQHLLNIPGVRTKNADVLGYADGGWTGPGGKHEPKGVVHGDEYVFSKEATQGNVAALDALHRNLRGYASGGLVGRSAAVRAASSGGGAEIDYDRLTAVLLAARPLRGDTYVQPHNYSEFRREQDAADRRSNSDGVRRGR